MIDHARTPQRSFTVLAFPCCTNNRCAVQGDPHAQDCPIRRCGENDRGAARDAASYQQLDLRRTAHIIVDLQNGFMEPGAPVEVPIARDIVPNVNRISAAVRANGGKNFFLRMTVDANSRAGWSNWFAHLHSRESGTALTEAFARDAHYWQLWPALEVADGDETVEKFRFGAFVPAPARCTKFYKVTASTP